MRTEEQNDELLDLLLKYDTGIDFNHVRRFFDDIDSFDDLVDLLDRNDMLSADFSYSSKDAKSYVFHNNLMDEMIEQAKTNSSLTVQTFATMRSSRYKRNKLQALENKVTEFLESIE